LSNASGHAESAVTNGLVLELKYRREMPVLFRKLAERFNLPS
jgi:hypothetical protein